ADLSLGLNRVERRTRNLVYPEEHADSFQSVPDETRENILRRLVIGEQLNGRVGEAQGKLAGQVLLQARIGDSRSLDLRIGENQTPILPSRFRHETVDDRIQRNLVRVERDVIGVTLDAKIEQGAGVEGRAIERKLKRS